MLPAVVSLGIGHRRSLWIPVPIFLLWPFWLLGWPIWGIMRALRIPGYRGLGIALSLTGRMSGMRLEMATREGRRVKVFFI